MKAKKYHEQNIGKSRYLKFQYILKNFLNQNITKKELLNLDKKFDYFIEKNKKDDAIKIFNKILK